jgi:SHS2 domain-containing protein
VSDPRRDDPGGSYEFFETEADVGVRASAPTDRDAFARAAEGVFALTADPATVEERERREVRAQADSDETLLVNWINECLYVHEIEGFVVRRVDVDTLGGGMVHGVLIGEEFDAARHRPGTIVKAATSHGVRVARTADAVEVSIVLDV